ncbi:MULTISPECIES: 30S ribosomal protein S17 [Francisella]|uniref:Small ribosomal subunit protein uS17 n=9 Tax=Francisella TaxID=262 RepID=RS17_FRATT|nr:MULTISPECIES: 30S ribosomal protein S17 [Francisella]A0Q4J2.1 RecName: Full=Small ribosomal subunit protein uS17; AltName: Full=30S ribosomal protein S17 [Francisella tularensis subsp. novicida U112]A4IZS5.1 RecName: Full=Small ribosomal subunit protein uS17; AltName: Full=30S ribosomal protein S17 [Francisella tularensis subsp. tularensis WY96-3418]B2SDX6.1 RecName: Full=Small ribosomal subunit protein uS17; AltName: Full=30S ribosomal protein S17 [Francisella tularensis subsp. mediasiatica 
MSDKIRLLEGKVSSVAMDKTVVVRAERYVKHPLYGKFVKKTTKYYVHDENNECKEGDVIKFKETRPYSKTKKWCLVDIIHREK